MALQEGRIALRFAGGVDTQEDDKYVALTDLLALENGIFVRTSTIAKRNGFTALERTCLDSSGALPIARATASRGNELLAFDSNAGYTRVDSASGWKRAGDIVCPVLSHTAVTERTTEQTVADRAELSDVVLYTWTETTGAYLAVYDKSTGRSLCSPTLFLASGIKTRAAVVGEVLMAFAVDTTNHRIYCAVVSPTNPTATPAGQILVEDLHATYTDYDVHTGTSRTVLAWCYQSGVIQVGYVAQSGDLGSSATSLPSVLTTALTPQGAIAVAMNNDSSQRVVLAYWDGTNVKRSLIDYALASVVATATVAAAPGCSRLSLGILSRDAASGSGTAQLVWDETTAGDRRVVLVTIDQSATLGTPVYLRKSKAAGRPFLDGDSSDDRMFIPIAYESTLFSTLFVVRDDGLIVARILSGLYGNAPTVNAVPNVQAESDDDRTHWTVAIYRTRLAGVNGDVYTERGVQEISLDFGAADSHQTVQIAKTAYLAGAGFLWQYDGEGFVEQGMHYAPDDVVAPSQGAPSGTGIANGTFLYRFAYGWKNAQGEIEWGPVSAGTSVTVSGGPRRLTFTLPTLRHTRKTSPRSEAIIGVFRSEDGDDQALYMVSSLDPSTVGSVNGYVLNSPSADSVTFYDEMTDATLISKDPLYTNGGTISNDPTPTGSVLRAVKDRLFSTDPSDEAVIRFGQVRRDGYVVEISPLLQQRFNSAGGPVTAAVQLDGSLVIFKRQSIFAMTGAGPTAANQGDFSDPQLLHADVGAIDARIVVPTPLGIVFLSEKGFRLLDRSGQVQYIGAKVEKYTDSRRSAQTFVSAELIPDRNEIRFLASSGVALHYDYFRNCWSTWPNVFGVAAEIVDGTYYYVRSDGDVYKETPGIYRDVNRHVPLAIETAWVKFTGYLQGWQRIWHAALIGNFKSDHQIRFRAAYDYEDNWITDILINPADSIAGLAYGQDAYGNGPYGGATEARLQVEFHLDAECQAAKFRIEDVEASGTYGAAFELSEILVTGGVQATKAVMKERRQG